MGPLPYILGPHNPPCLANKFWSYCFHHLSISECSSSPWDFSPTPPGQAEVSVHPGTSQRHVLSRLRPHAAGTQKGWRGTKLPAVLCIQWSRDQHTMLFRCTRFYSILTCQDNLLRSYNKGGKIAVVVYLAFLFNFRKDRFLKIETQRGGDPADSISPTPISNMVLDSGSLPLTSITSLFSPS